MKEIGIGVGIPSTARIEGQMSVFRPLMPGSKEECCELVSRKWVCKQGSKRYSVSSLFRGLSGGRAETSQTTLKHSCEEGCTLEALLFLQDLVLRKAIEAIEAIEGREAFTAQLKLSVRGL